LILIHYPAAASIKHKDPKNIELRNQTWKALEESVKSLKVKSIGVSNFKVWHLESLMKTATI
jgi:diketogulonate reductase-like aldo/keto reductase